MVESAPSRAGQITLGEALTEYLHSLKQEQRSKHEHFVRRFVNDQDGGNMTVENLSPARIESWAERELKSTDPNAGDRAAALKGWFQYLKKKGYAKDNFGIHIRVKKSSGKAGSSATSVTAPPLEMTADGMEGLKQELDELSTRRIEIVHAIEVARQDGDLRENAPYHAAREALAFNEQRQRQIENALKRAVVVERSGRDDCAGVGSVVTVTNLEKETQQISYMLVGAREANAAEKKISIESPVGRKLLGTRKGEEVVVDIPGGRTVTYRVEAVTQS